MVSDELRISKPESPKFKVGDVVRLRSGGPSMTVVGVAGNTTVMDWVKCTWFDVNTHNVEATFLTATLQTA